MWAQQHSIPDASGHDTTTSTQVRRFAKVYDQQYIDTNESQQDAAAHQSSTAQLSLVDGDTKQEGNDNGLTDDYEMPSSPTDPDVGMTD